MPEPRVPEIGADELACPTCGKPIPIAAQRRPASFPFCSSRCRDRDFGRWIDGAYTVAAVADEQAAGDQGPSDGQPP